MVMDSNWAFPKSLCILLLVFPYGVHGKKGPCCSQDNKKCTSWMKQYDANDCASHNDKNVWFPDGDKDQKSSCANLWSNKDCSEHEDCCGMQGACKYFPFTMLPPAPSLTISLLPLPCVSSL